MPLSSSSATTSGAEDEVQTIAGGLEHRQYGWFASFRAMGSPCEVHVAGAERATAALVVAAVAAEAFRIERKYSRYRAGNVVDRINKANGAPVAVDAETAGLLTYADRLFTLSDGRFDITSGVLRKVWTFDGGSELPAEGDMREAMRLVGWRRARWTAPELVLEPGMEIDLGGIGKEYAVDRAAANARTIWPRCLVNFGGDLAVTGGIDGGGWNVGIQGLSAPDLPAATIRLTLGALATSGDTQRYKLRDGKRYGHILDPQTGWPVVDAPRSITVAAPSCTQAGMLATLAMLRGADAEAFLDEAGVDYWCLR